MQKTSVVVCVVARVLVRQSGENGSCDVVPDGLIGKCVPVIAGKGGLSTVKFRIGICGLLDARLQPDKDE